MIWRIDTFKINGVSEKSLIEGMFVRQVKTVKIYKHSVNNFLQHATTKKKKKKKKTQEVSRSVSENNENWIVSVVIFLHF